MWEKDPQRCAGIMSDGRAMLKENPASVAL
jgi:hypothetical protein